MKREYCCTNCGLIWFTETSITSKVECPECNNHIGLNTEFHIYACDTFGWFYASTEAVKNLKKRGKEIHYHKEHPWYGRK